jgi:hypothetical protein
LSVNFHACSEHALPPWGGSRRYQIEILALDAQGGERFRQRVATPQGDYDATLRAIATLVQNAERALGVRAA